MKLLVGRSAPDHPGPDWLRKTRVRSRAGLRRRSRCTAARGRESAGDLTLITLGIRRLPHPSDDGRRRSLQAALRHHLQHVPQTELEPQDPSTLFSSPIANSHSAQHASMAD